jgi:ribonuclease R
MVRSERLFAHRLIEEMMLAANVEVAKFISSKEIPGLYRIHDSPNTEAIGMLERYIHNFGGNVRLGAGKLQKRLTRALQEFEGKPEALILNILTLRSMSQAKYSPANIGHFGLGFEFYSHFTSPIRRYPDLIIHRLLKSQINVRGYRPMSEEDLSTAGLMLSACEQRSVKAERQFVSIKKARFIKQHIGKEFDGMISSVTKFGVFVLLRQFEVDGLVRMENLSKEKLFFDEESLRLVGKRSGVRFSIGDQVRVRVDKAEADSGQIDFGYMGKLDLTGKVEVTSIYTPRSRGEKFSDRKGGRNGDQHRKSNAGKSDHPPRKSSSSKTEKTFSRSKKLQYADKKEPAREQSPATSRGDFDPAAHFDKVMAKWKGRQPPSLQQPGRRSTVEEEDSREGSGKTAEKRADRLHFGERYSGKKTTKKNDGGQRRSQKSKGFRK